MVFEGAQKGFVFVKKGAFFAQKQLFSRRFFAVFGAILGLFGQFFAVFAAETGAD